MPKQVVPITTVVNQNDNKGLANNYKTQRRIFRDHTEHSADDVVLTSHQLYEQRWRRIRASMQVQNTNFLTQHLDCNQSQDLPKE
jgi:hypothetical protein